jgi:hypothetical protein
MNARLHLAFTSVSAVVVALTLFWGFFLVGSPSTRRQQRFDEQRLRDLQNIAQAIQILVEDPNEKGKLKAPLPPTLADASRENQGALMNLFDPETGVEYVYRVKEDGTYDLCATFSEARHSTESVFWNHPAGEHCFTINPADPPPFY